MITVYRGINIRYLMILHKHVISIPSIKALVTTEMVARTAKHDLMDRWRKVQSTDDLDYKKQALLYFNLLFGSSAESTAYWGNELLHQIKGNNVVTKGSDVLQRNFCWKIAKLLLNFKLKKSTNHFSS